MADPGAVWLDAIIRDRGITVPQVMAATGVTRQTIYNWRRGHHRPKDEHAAVLADLLCLHESDLRRRLGMHVPDNQESTAADEARLGRAVTELEDLAAYVQRRVDIISAERAAVARGTG